MRLHRVLPAVPAVLAVALSTACSSGAGDEASVGAAESIADESIAVAPSEPDDESPGEPARDEPAREEHVQEESAEPEPADQGQVADEVVDGSGSAIDETVASSTSERFYDGVPEMAVRVAATDVPGRPQIAWEPVDGAVSYELALALEDGTRYWAWDGSATTIHIGGEVLLGERSAGPRLLPEMRFWVIARDASGAPIGQSAILSAAG